jgi:uncharacterized metal-binding protein
MKTTAEAERILAIDGCEADCTKLTLQLASFTNFKHLRITDLGLRKGAAPPNLENITLVVDAATELLTTPHSGITGESA